jgi:hypothetical protein
LKNHRPSLFTKRSKYLIEAIIIVRDPASDFTWWAKQYETPLAVSTSQSTVLWPLKWVVASYVRKFSKTGLNPSREVIV